MTGKTCPFERRGGAILRFPLSFELKSAMILRSPLAWMRAFCCRNKGLLLFRRKLFFSAVVCCSTIASAQLRVVSFNTSNSSSATSGPRVGMDVILRALGDTVSDDPTTPGNSGIAKPIDLLCLQESHGAATTGASYAALLNNIYNTNRYRWVDFNGTSTGSGTQVMVYDSSSVQFIDAAAVGTSSTSGQPRQTTRFRMRPVGYSSAADVYVYNAHWKSSTDSTSRNRRLIEANATRTDADALPANSNIIYLGDLNVYTSTEPAYAAMSAAGNGRATDPINLPGSWSGNAAFKAIHTQSPYDPAVGANTGFNGTTGGVDDRFDQQLVSANLNDGDGVAYIPNSYYALGNNGSHQIDQSIDTGTGATYEVLQALAGIVDHLPVSADYQLPAKMSVNVSAVPQRVIRGAAVTANVAVNNSAPVATTNGADELSYSVATTGSINGTGSGTAWATQPAQHSTVTIDTSTTGVRSGTINVTSSSQAVADGTFSQAISTTVLAPSRPSFSASADQTELTIDFGVYAAGNGGFAVRPFSLANRANINGFTATMDFDGVLGGGALSVSGAETTNIAADGFGRSFELKLDRTAGIGIHDSSLILLLSDENIPGELQHSLNLNVQARLALAGDADLNGTVNITDFARLAAAFNQNGLNWGDGDFDRNGAVNLTDFAMLAANFNTSASRLAIPEPASIFLPTFALTVWCRKQRR